MPCPAGMGPSYGRAESDGATGRVPTAGEQRDRGNVDAARPPSPKAKSSSCPQDVLQDKPDQATEEGWRSTRLTTTDHGD